MINYSKLKEMILSGIKETSMKFTTILSGQSSQILSKRIAAMIKKSVPPSLTRTLEFNLSITKVTNKKSMRVALSKRNNHLDLLMARILREDYRIVETHKTQMGGILDQRRLTWKTPTIIVDHRLLLEILNNRLKNKEL